MMRRAPARLALAAFLATLAAGTGCSKRHHIAIESNTCWIAIIDRDRTAPINDCGNRSYRIAGEVHCVAVTNVSDTSATTDPRFVRVRIDDSQWSETRTRLGTAEACR